LALHRPDAAGLPERDATRAEESTRRILIGFSGGLSQPFNYHPYPNFNYCPTSTITLTQGGAAEISIEQCDPNRKLTMVTSV
jgi:hypothetical protein